MKTINRMPAVFKPKQPYLDWINSLPGTGRKMTMDELQDDKTCYLTPIYDDNGDALEFILKSAKKILETELSGWDTSGDYWPKTLNRKLLREFFDIEICSEVFDTMSGPIEREDYF